MRSTEDKDKDKDISIDSDEDKDARQVKCEHAMPQMPRATAVAPCLIIPCPPK